MASVTVSDLDKQFGETRVLEGVSLFVPEGSFAVLVGPSGCRQNPRSLRLLAGSWRRPTAGRIRFPAIAT